MLKVKEVKNTHRTSWFSPRRGNICLVCTHTNLLYISPVKKINKFLNHTNYLCTVEVRVIKLSNYSYYIVAVISTCSQTEFI